MANCVITGTLYNLDGSLGVGAVLRVVKVVAAGFVYTSSPVEYTADGNGQIQMTFPRESTVWLAGAVIGFNNPGQTGFQGTPIYVPDDPTGVLSAIAPAQTVPNTVPVVIPGAAEGYEHTQATPSATWTIPHALGYKPLVFLYDSNSNGMDGKINSTTSVTTVTFTTAVAGSARLI